MTAALYSAADGVATITLNRPEKLNAFSAALFEGVRAGLDAAEADESVRVVVFTGRGGPSRPGRT